MSPTRRSLLISSVALAVASCATQARLTTSDQAWPELEAMTVTAGREGLTVRVASRGCATRDDFVFHLDRSGAKPVLAFARRRVELCRSGAPLWADLMFSYKELGVRRGERIVIANPILSPSA